MKCIRQYGPAPQGMLDGVTKSFIQLDTDAQASAVTVAMTILCTQLCDICINLGVSGGADTHAELQT